MGRSRAWTSVPTGDDPPVAGAARAAGATSDLAPHLAALSAELAIAGARARARAAHDADAAPRPMFAAALRAELLSDVAARSPAARPIAVEPAIRRERLFEHVPAPRWTALAVGTVIAFAAIGMTADPRSAVPPQAHVTSASAASITSGGGSRAAGPGAALLAGDVLAVAPGGRAVLAIGTSEVRLAGGTTVELDRVAPTEVALVQRTGRGWYRVDVAGGLSFSVRTASVSWTAHRAAFDLLRTAAGGDEDRVAVVAVQGSVAFRGPDLDGALVEGRRAAVRLGGDLPDVAIGTARSADLADGWLLENAGLDRDQGLPLGILTSVPADGAVTSR